MTDDASPSDASPTEVPQLAQTPSRMDRLEEQMRQLRQELDELRSRLPRSDAAK
jgi:hypothetical protein